MVAAHLRCVALQTAEAAMAVGMARPPARPRVEQELAPPSASGVVGLHRDSRTGPSCQQHREVCCLADIFLLLACTTSAQKLLLACFVSSWMAGKACCDPSLLPTCEMV